MDFNKVLEVEAPHGYLMAQGKKTAIARIEPLDIEQSYLVVSNGEAYGVAEFEQPAQIKTKDFDSEEWKDCHRVTGRERRQWWPDVENFYVYRLKEWTSFEGIKLYEDGQIVDEPKLTSAQWQIVSAAKELPRQIQIIPDAVSVTDKQEFLICPGAKIDQLNDILAATFETDIKEANENWNEIIDLYSLALVRNPRMRVSKKSPEAAMTETKQEDEVMPFRIRKRDDEFCVVKINPDDTEETMACHETEQEAEAQLTALRINVEAEESKDTPYEIQKRGKLYFVVNTEDGGSVGDHYTEEEAKAQLARVIEFEKEKTFTETNPEDKAVMPGFSTMIQTGNEEYAKKDAAQFDLIEKSIAKKRPEFQRFSLFSQLRNLGKSIGDFLSLAETEQKEDEVNILTSNYGVAQKEVNGEPWHFTWSTNAFEDREGEIFSTESLENYVSQAESKADKGFFNLWHINAEDGNFNTDFAKKEWQGVVGRFLVEAGPYLEGRKGQAAKKFFSEFGAGHPKIAPEGWGCSPEFKYLPEERATGIYKNIWITRTSTLPKFAAANVWTETRQLARSKNMALSEDQIKAAVEVFQDEEFVKSLIQEGESKTAELEAAGVAHKGETEQPEPQKININMEELAAEVGKQFAANLDPIAEAMATMATELKELKEWKDKQNLAQGVVDKTEMPRYVFEFKRASESDATIVTEDDGKNAKPVETQAGKGDAWSQVFNK
jgi:hypothetical protein